jgi:hypothetical protein
MAELVRRDAAQVGAAWLRQAREGAMSKAHAVPAAAPWSSFTPPAEPGQGRCVAAAPVPRVPALLTSACLQPPAAAAGPPPLQDGELMAQDQDLRGLPCLLTAGQPQPRCDPRDQEEHEPQAHDR